MSEPTDEAERAMHLPRNLSCARCGQAIRRAEGFAYSRRPNPPGQPVVRYYHLSRERPCFQKMNEDET